MIYRYFLSLAGAQWTIQLPISLETGEHCDPFLTDGSEKEDIFLRYETGEAPIRGEKLRETYPRIHEDRDGYFVERERVCSFCSCIYIAKQRSARFHGWIFSGKEKNFQVLDQILAVSEMEILLSAIDAFCLHSSLIRYQNSAVLFTAPSGTGKSTQAELWEEHRGAEVLNGDRSLVRKIEGEWTAFGSPFAGSSEIYRNESAPIRCIVVLRQSKQNEVKPLAVSDAFRLLYSETVIPRWHQEVHQHLMDMLEQIIEDVPVLLLQCTPDVGAVEVLERYMEEHKL